MSDLLSSVSVSGIISELISIALWIFVIKSLRSIINLRKEQNELYKQVHTALLDINDKLK